MGARLGPWRCRIPQAPSGDANTMSPKAPQASCTTRRSHRPGTRFECRIWVLVHAIPPGKGPGFRVGLLGCACNPHAFLSACINHNALTYWSWTSWACIPVHLRIPRFQSGFGNLPKTVRFWRLRSNFTGPRRPRPFKRVNCMHLMLRQDHSVRASSTHWFWTSGACIPAIFGFPAFDQASATCPKQFDFGG